MADQSIRGRFVWHELTTPDAAGAHSFYSKALGWKTESWDQDPSYQMFVAGSGPLGGSVTEPNGTPHWLTYIGTPDIAATIEQAKSLGGSVVKELTSMPNGGAYAILTDPQGANFGVYASQAEHGKETAPKRGEFSWHELATSDYQGAFDFYSALFGWERIAEHDMGEMGKYFLFGSKGVQKGGMYNKAADMKGPPAWLGYVRVKDVNQTVRKVKSARGTLVNGPMEVPGGDWIAQFLDPYGAMFATHTMASDLQTQASAPPREEEQTSEPSGAAPAPAKTEAPARRAAKKPARKASARPAAKAAKPAAKKTTGKKASKKKAAGKKAGSRKAGSKKKSTAKKKAAGKKRPAARSAKRPARKAARSAKRGGKKKAARRKK